MAGFSFGTQGATPGLTGTGVGPNPSSQLTVGGTPQSRALSSLGSGLSFSPSGSVATTAAQPTAPAQPAADWSKYVTSGFLSPNSGAQVKSHSVGADGSV